MAKQLRSNDDLPLTVSQLLELYKAVGETEAHFNRIQSQYRLLSSTWLLAAIGAAGFVLSNSEKMPIPAPEVAGLICGAATIGTVLIWLLDLQIYQRLLHSNYLEAMAMEEAFPALPKIRKRIRVKFSFRLPILMASFYLGQACLLWLLACGLLFIDWPVTEETEWLELGVPTFLGWFLLAGLMFYPDWPSRRAVAEQELQDRIKVYEDTLIHDTSPPREAVSQNR